MYFSIVVFSLYLVTSFFQTQAQPLPRGSLHYIRHHHKHIHHPRTHSDFPTPHNPHELRMQLLSKSTKQLPAQSPTDTYVRQKDDPSSGMHEAL